ncbi:MAG: ATP-binding protein [Burkholderiales bacterium]|nr:ATP-binding protein [Burkholderiales bacterium]
MTFDNNNDIFPSKLALDQNFCNRQEERFLLKNNIAQCRHTVLVSPRRYGKSSLVHQVVSELAIPSSSVDLFLAHNDMAIARRILQGVSAAASAIMPPSEKLLSKIQEFFSSFKVSLTAKFFSIEAVHTGTTFDAIDNIFQALRSLAKIAKTHKNKVIFFIDEFQDINVSENAKSIQGAIRHIAQETSEIVFIFSGSNRRLLLELFDDKSMPLYMLCDKLILERISSVDYHIHLQKLAQAKWGAQLSEYTFNQIMKLTEAHTFYVNMLCHQLWKLKKIPQTDEVNQAWEYCFELEKRRLVAELEKLTPNQQDLLKALALNPIKEPSGQDFIKTVGKAYSTIRQGIKSLQEKDMIYIVNNEDVGLPMIKKGQIRILDPLLGYAVRKFT